MTKQFFRYFAYLVLAAVQIFTVMVAFESRSQAADTAPTQVPYVRVSRAFFEKPLRAEVKLSSPAGPAGQIAQTGSGSDSSTYSSPVQWVQYPPTAPAPQQSDPKLGQVLGDFRDFVACAEMTALGQARLCFKVMGDVSNLGLNDREMTLRGIDTISSANPQAGQCSSANGPNGPSANEAGSSTASPRYLVQKAAVTSNSLELEFKYSNACAPNVQLTLTQVP